MEKKRGVRMLRECEEVRVQIWSLFTKNYTVKEVEIVRAITNRHLLECKECREYLREMLEQKKKEMAK